MTECPYCHGSGIVNPELIVSLVCCTCGHGGKAWHTQVFGKCNYSNCQCSKLIVKYANVGVRTLDPIQFSIFLKENTEGVCYS